MINVISLYLFWLILGVIALLIFPKFLKTPSAIWMIRSIGFLLWAFISWLVQLLTQSTFAPEYTMAALILLTIGLCFKDRNRIPELQKTIIAENFITSEVVTFLLFSISLLICSFHPEITWGERPMDSTFLRYFMRMPTLPPADPWAAAIPMRYYYWGAYLFGIVAKMLHIPGGVAYTLSMASVWTLLGLNLIAFFKAIKLSLKFSILGVLAVLGTGNYALLWIQATQSIHGFDLFWASTRLLTSPTFSEFPLWTFLFYDLHSHYTAWIPESVFWVSLVLLCSERSKVFAILSGFSFALIFFTNVWAWIASGILISILFLFYKLSFRLWLFFGISAFVTMIPFYLHLPKGAPLGLPALYQGPANTLQQLILFSGHWWILSFALFNYRKFILVPFLRLQDFLILSFILLGIAFLFYFSNAYQLNTQFSLFTWVALFGAAWTLQQTGPESPSRFLWVFVFAGMLLVVLSESFVWIDRMNSVFKWWLPAHFWIAIGLTGLLLRRASQKKWILILFVLFLMPNWLSGAQSILIMTKHRFAIGPRPTLDGDAFLKTTTPDEAKAFQFLNQTAEKDDTLIEATGGHYDGRARVAQFTGIPIVLGWEHHTRQRGTPEETIQARISQVKKLYQSVDVTEKLKIALDLKARWIFVGVKEQQHYPGEGLNMLASTPGIILRFESVQVRVYEVVSKSGP